jgi:hypothetical protein
VTLSFSRLSSPLSGQERSWGFALRSFPLPRSRAPSQGPLPSCRQLLPPRPTQVTPHRSRDRPHPGSRAFFLPKVRCHTMRCYPHRTARCSPGLPLPSKASSHDAIRRPSAPLLPCGYPPNEQNPLRSLPLRREPLLHRPKTMACAFLGSVHLVLSHASSSYLGSGLCVQPRTQVTSLPLGALYEPSVTLASSLPPKLPELHLSVARMAAPGSGFFHPQQCNLSYQITRSTTIIGLLEPLGEPHTPYPVTPPRRPRVRLATVLGNPHNSCLCEATSPLFHSHLHRALTGFPCLCPPGVLEYWSSGSERPVTAKSSGGQAGDGPRYPRETTCPA